MIEVFPDGGWLANGILSGIVVTTAAVAAFLTLRWGWKAWPLVLLAALAVPIIITAVLMFALPLLSDPLEASGFLVHGRTLALIGISSALLGFAVALRWRSAQPKAR